MKERPRRGGLGYLFVTTNEDGTERVDPFSPPGTLGATSQEMEVRAVLEALATVAGKQCPVDLARFSKIVIYTDSTLVTSGYRTARAQQRRKLTGRGGQPLIHTELWTEINRLVNRLGLPVYVEYTKGKGSKYAKRVHRLAFESADRPTAQPKIVRHSRRKHSPGSVEAGSVPVRGQTLEVQAISSQWLPEHQLFHVKYEVMAGDLEGAVDFAFVKPALRTSFIYRVELNEDPGFPQFARVVEKVGPSRRKTA